MAGSLQRLPSWATGAEPLHYYRAFWLQAGDNSSAQAQHRRLRRVAAPASRPGRPPV